MTVGELKKELDRFDDGLLVGTCDNSEIVRLVYEPEVSYSGSNTRDTHKRYVRLVSGGTNE